MLKLGFSFQRVIFAFSDPSGAKALAALYLIQKSQLGNCLLVSDRYYSFYDEMEIDVKVLEKGEVKDIIDLFNPDCIFTASSFPEKIELEFIKYGNYKNIYTLTFVDHWTNMALRFLSDNQMVLPKLIYVIDENAKRQAEKEGIPSKLLMIMNNPYYQYLEKWIPSKSRLQFLKQLNLFSNSEFVLYAPEPFSTFGLERKYGFSEVDGLLLLSKLFFQIKGNEYLLVVKCHPNQDVQKLKEAVNQLSAPWTDRILVYEEGDIKEFIYFSNYVIGHFSNSMIEADRMQRRTVRMLIGLNEGVEDPLAHLNIGQIARTEMEMLKIMSKYK